MKYLALIFSIAILSGCADDHRGACIRQVQEAYCKPSQIFAGGYTQIVYDCTGINSPAYDEAIKACVAAYSK